MQPERQASDSEVRGRRGRVAWSLLAIFLIVLPLVAVGRIMVATDDELADVRAQALAEMEIDHRVNHNVTYVTSFGWHQDMSTHNYSISYDCVVLKLNTRVTFTNVQGSGLYALNYGGFWGKDAGGWDVYLGEHVFGQTINDSGTWDSDRSITMNGVRIEFAYDEIDSVDRRFLFFRFGTDDMRGRFSTSNQARYISFDGILDNPLEATLATGSGHIWPGTRGHRTEPYMRMNYHRQTLTAKLPMSTSLGRQPLTIVNYMDFGPGTPSSGRTDFYISIADTITATSNVRGTHGGGPYPTAHHVYPTVITNDGRALGPWNMARNTIPGRGLWMHFQRGYVSAEVSMW